MAHFQSQIHHAFIMYGFRVVVALVAFYTATALAAFGLTSDSSSYTVDAGSANPLVYKVSRTNCDITSILYRGRQLQKAGPYSHINSGLGTATVSAKVVSGECYRQTVSFKC